MKSGLMDVRAAEEVESPRTDWFEIAASAAPPRNDDVRNDGMTRILMINVAMRARTRGFLG